MGLRGIAGVRPGLEADVFSAGFFGRRVVRARRNSRRGVYLHCLEWDVCVQRDVRYHPGMGCMFVIGIYMITFSGWVVSGIGGAA